MLHENTHRSNPYGEDFDYAEEVKKLDVEALKADIIALMTHVAGLVARRLRPLRPAFSSE